MTGQEKSRSLMRRAAELSPLWLGVAYVVAQCAANVMSYFGLRDHVRLLALAAFAIAIGAMLTLYIVITWYRDDDALPAGVLLALTILIGGSVANIVVAGLTERSFTAAFAQLLFAPMRFLTAGLVGVPLAALLVWAARLITRAVERASGIAPETPATPARPYRSVWERREAKRNQATGPTSK